MLEGFYSADVFLKDTPDEFGQDQNMQSLFPPPPPPPHAGMLDMRTGNLFSLFFFLFYYFQSKPVV